MGKLTAVIAGVAILLSFSYYVLSASFSPLINWIGPVLGFRLDLMLGLMWLEQGTPLQYALIFALWAVVGVIVGISSRRYRAVFSTSALLWIILGIIVAISIGALAVGILKGGGTGSLLNSFSTLNYVPPGSNIYSILHEPVISRWYNLLLSLITGGSLTTLISSWSRISTASKLTEIFGIVFPFILGPLEAFVILVVFGVIGLYLKRLFFGDNSGPKKEKKLRKSKIAVLVIVAGLIASSGAIVLEDNLHAGGGISVSSSDLPVAELSPLSSIITTVVPNVIGGAVSLPLQSTSDVMNGAGGCSQTSIPNAGVYALTPSMFAFPNGTYKGGIALSLLEKQGSLLNVYGVMNFSDPSSGFLSTPTFNNSEFSFVVLQSNLYQMVQSFENSSNSSDFSKFNISSLSGFSPSSLTGLVNLVPGYLFVIAYNGSFKSTSGYAASAASYMASSLGISGYMNLISLNTAGLTNLTHTTSTSTNTKSGSAMSVYVYAAEPDYGGAAQNFSKNILSQIDNGPVSDLIHSAVDSGYLVPGRNSLSSSSSVIVYGNINSRLFSTLLNNTTAKAYSFLTRGGSFVLDLSEWQHRFYSSNSDSYSASDMFGYDGPLNVSSSEITVLGFGSDISSSLTNVTSLVSGMNVSLLTNYPSVSGSLARYSNNSTSIKFTAIPNGTIYLSHYKATVNASLPANLSVNMDAKQLSGNRLKLVFTVVNNGDQSLNNVNISLQKFFSDYGNMVERVSNSPTSVYINSIGPGQNDSFSSTVILKGTGSYYLPPLTATYSFGGHSFRTQYGSGYWLHAQKPSVEYAVTFSVLTLISLYPPLEPLSHFYLGPLNIVELVILIIIVIDVFLEYRAFVAWRNGRRQTNRGSEELTEPKK